MWTVSSGTEIFSAGWMDDTPKTLTRSQGGSGGGLALSICSACRVTWLEPQLFLCRFRLPFSLTLRDRWDFPFDVCSHHRATKEILGKKRETWIGKPWSGVSMLRETNTMMTSNLANNEHHCQIHVGFVSVIVDTVGNRSHYMIAIG